MLPVEELVRADVRNALAEDLGSGDLTAALLGQVHSSAYILCRESAVLAGVPWLRQVFSRLDASVEVEMLAKDGDTLVPGQRICRIIGNAAAILSGERTALNFLQTLSATATLTARYVQAVAGTGVRILDTRKTLPGMRGAQKYAVRCGGGQNHRMGLYDAILIKENHIAALGSVEKALTRARAQNSGVEIEIEIETLAEMEEALAAGANRMLLDNFSIEQLRQAVELNDRRARLEASGGIRLENIRSFAETGVDDISIGALTKDVCAVDFSLLFETETME